MEGATMEAAIDPRTGKDMDEDQPVQVVLHGGGDRPKNWQRHGGRSAGAGGASWRRRPTQELAKTWRKISR